MANSNNAGAKHVEKTVEIESCTLYENNPQLHPQGQIDALAESLTRFGQYRPLVLDEANTVLAGNGMLLAMRQLGWSKAKAIQITGLSKSEKTKLVLADNRLAEMSSTDYDLLEDALRTLSDFEVPGFEEDSLRQLLADLEETTEEASTYGILPEAEVERLESMEDPKPVPRGPESWGDAEDIQDIESGETEERQVCPTCQRPW